MKAWQSQPTSAGEFFHHASQPNHINTNLYRIFTRMRCHKMLSTLEKNGALRHRTALIKNNNNGNVILRYTRSNETVKFNLETDDSHGWMEYSGGTGLCDAGSESDLSIRMISTKVSSKLTLTNATRCLFVFAIFLVPQLMAISADLGGLSSSSESSKSPDEPGLSGSRISPWLLVEESTDASLPMHIENHPRTEMYAAHNSLDRWRKALAKAIAISENSAPTFDSSIRALQTQTNRYALNPPFVEPEHFQVSTREDRGEPVSRPLLERGNPHLPN